MIVDIDPTIFRFWIFEVRYYGLLFGSAFITGYLILLWIWKKEERPYEEVDLLVLYIALGVVIGARLGHTMFYQPDYYLSHPLEILKVWQGGLASHGAAMGVLIASFLYIRKYKYEFSWLCDRVAIPLSIGTSFIRLGNFTNSEIVGRATDLPWAVTFLRYDNVPRHPSQIYEVMMGVFLFIILLWIYRKYGSRLKTGTLFGTFVTGYFCLRFLVEYFKEYQALSQSFPFTMGQLLSLPFVILGIIILVRIKPFELLPEKEETVKGSHPENQKKRKKKKKK